MRRSRLCALEGAAQRSSGGQFPSSGGVLDLSRTRAALGARNDSFIPHYGLDHVNEEAIMGGSWDYDIVGRWCRRTRSARAAPPTVRRWPRRGPFFRPLRVVELPRNQTERAAAHPTRANERALCLRKMATRRRQKKRQRTMKRVSGTTFFVVRSLRRRPREQRSPQSCKRFIKRCGCSRRSPRP